MPGHARAPEHRAGAGVAADIATLKALHWKGRVARTPAAVMR
jgi:hydroxymethylpyrimidine/phosphomethylpyrimidine kinase